MKVVCHRSRGPGVEWNREHYRLNRGGNTVVAEWLVGGHRTKALRRSPKDLRTKPDPFDKDERSRVMKIVLSGVGTDMTRVRA